MDSHVRIADVLIPSAAAVGERVDRPGAFDAVEIAQAGRPNHLDVQVAV